jgi:hypothetical protein
MMNSYRFHADRISISGAAGSLVDHLPQPLIDQATSIQTVCLYLRNGVVLLLIHLQTALVNNRQMYQLLRACLLVPPSP